MGQKSNPIILRLGKTNSWKSKYLEQKTQESAVYSFKSIEIEKFINKFFKDNDMIIHNCKLFYSDNNSLHVFISYYLTFQSVAVIKELNKSQQIKLKRIRGEVKTRKRYVTLVRQLLKFIYYKDSDKTFTTQISKKKLKKTKKIIQKYKNSDKPERIRLLQNYKTYLYLKKYKQINELNHNFFLEKFLESLHLFLKKNTKIFLTLKQLNKNLKESFHLTKKNIKLLKTFLVKLRKYKRNDFFKTGLTTLFLTTTQPEGAALMAKFVTNQLQQLKRHNFFFRFLKASIDIILKSKFSHINGIKLKIKGRINGRSRAKHKILTIGKKGVPVLSINSNIDYAEKTAFTQNGTIGVKVWIHLKN